MASPATTSTSTLKDIADQIFQLPKPWADVDLHGLVGIVTTYLVQESSKGEANAVAAAPEVPLQCTSISFLGSGSFHHVYQLCFNDGTKLAASVTKPFKEFFSPEEMESEIATMQFVRESGLYPDVPVPAVHTWDTTFHNPVGAPYLVMDVVDGVQIENTQAEGHERFVLAFDVYPQAQQLAIVKALARLQAALSRPVPFDRLGAMPLDAAAPGGYAFGPILGFADDSGKDDETSVGTSFKSAQELWYAHLENRMSFALEEWCSWDTDLLRLEGKPIVLTPQTFSNTYRKLCALLPHFEIPKPHDTLVLHHPDIALRSIFFDEASLASGNPRMTGVIDCSGAETSRSF